MPDVRMPDGTIIRNVPEGTPRSQIEAAWRKSKGGQRENPIANTIGGWAEGALSIPDALWDAATGVRRAVNQGVGNAGAAGLRAIGADGAADWWERGSRGVEQDLARMPKPSTPATRLAPPPRSTAGKAARFGAQMLGGAMVPLTPRFAPAPSIPRPKAPAANSPDMAVVRAGQRQKIPVRQPDAIPALRGDMATAEASPYAGYRVSQALDADKAAIQARLSEVAGGGNVQTESYNLGQQIQKVGRKYIETTGKQAGQMYREADKLANGQRISPANAIAEIDANIAELSAQGAFSNKATINYLQGLRDDLAKPGGFSITEFQGLRTAARNAIKGSQELTATDAERRLGNVVRAFTQDGRAQLPQAASRALDDADAFYSQRMGFISGVLQKHVLGKRNNPLSAETTARNLEAMAKNRADYDTFARFWGVADPETQADFSATLASKLGVRKGDFGLGNLKNDIADIPDNIAETIYGPQGAESLRDIATIAGAKSGTAKGLNNSRSGVVLARDIARRVLPAVGVGSVAGGLPGAIAFPILGEAGAAAYQLRNAGKLLSTDFGKYGVQELPSLLDTAAPYASRAPIAAANMADELGGMLNTQLLARAAAERDDSTKKKKKR